MELIDRARQVDFAKLRPMLSTYPPCENADVTDLGAVTARRTVRGVANAKFIQAPAELLALQESLVLIASKYASTCS
jgi:hypothetical protein